MPDDQPFDGIEIRSSERQVLVSGVPVTMGSRAFDVLLALYERRDRVVAKTELLELVWPGLVVEENNLQVQVSTLRKLLGPSAITTVPGRGYRFTVPADAVIQIGGSEREAQGAPTLEGAVPTNLPAASPLYGRDADLAAVAELLRHCPVVSIVGAGGIGKTRLAVALADSSDGDLPQGRWWVELASINDAAQVPAAIAGAIGVQLPAGQVADQSLGEALSARRMLLVLDNCEHLADGLANIVAVLRAKAPGVRLLITSQESLKCVDEQVYRLGPLELPPSEDPEEASRYGAVALFVARARAVDPRFRLARDNVAAVIDICRRLDGLPLAIELAAARVPLLGVAGLQARLDQMFDVLTGVARMKLRRHQTLRAALDWSYGLLSDEERAVFRRAGVFAGGFTLELAQRVAQDERSDQWGVVDLLAQLIDKSLVIAEGEGEPRYRLLEPARAFALEQLAAAGESAPMLRRHAEALADVMEASDRAQWSEPFERRLSQRAELGNLRAALEWAISDRGDVELAYRLLGRSWFVWLANNVPLEGFGWMLRFWPVHEGLEPEIEAAFCLAMANLRPASPGDEVLQSACRAAELYRRLGDSSRLADALIRVAVSAMARKGTVATEEVLHEAARLVTDAAPLRQQAALAMVQGGWALEKSDYKGAIAAFRRQADCARRDGNTLGELLALSNVALGLLDDGKVDEAVDILNRCIAGMQRIQAPYGIANTRSLLAVALAVRGDTADVLALASDAFHHLSMVGASAFSRPLLAAALYHARRGDLRRASLVAGVALDALQKDTGHLCPIETRMKDQLLELAASAGIAERVLVWLRAGASLTPTQASGIAFADQPLDEECV